VGNIIVDFNYEVMSSVLKIPDEKFRDKVYQTLKENLTTIRRELGDENARQWNEAQLNALMAEEFEKVLGHMQRHTKDRELQAKIDEVGLRILTDSWLFQKGKRSPDWDVKIRAGVNIVRKVHKAAGGFIRADFELIEGRFGKVALTGDFFCFPKGAIRQLEENLEGQPTGETRKVLAAFFSERGVVTPGIKLDDWMQILGAY
jgi:lipoate-protein ligase A